MYGLSAGLENDFLLHSLKLAPGCTFIKPSSLMPTLGIKCREVVHFPTDPKDQDPLYGGKASAEKHSVELLHTWRIKET